MRSRSGRWCNAGAQAVGLPPLGPVAWCNAGAQARGLLLLLLLLLSLPSCGYSTGSLMPEGIESIAVPIAKNDTFYRGDEFAYTRFLTEEILHKTQAQIRERRCADAVLCTRLIHMRRVPLVEGKDDVLLEEGLVGTVVVTLTDRRSGRTITEFTLERRSEGIRARGETLEDERVKLMRELAQDTVVRLEGVSFLAARGYPTGTWDTRPATRPSAATSR